MLGHSVICFLFKLKNQVNLLNLVYSLTVVSAPGSPPQHPNAIPLGPTSIHITWDPPLLEDHNGVIREYRLNITETLTNTLLEKVTNQTQIVVTGLKPYHRYNCTIVAVTVDEGPYTVAVTVITDEDGMQKLL